LSITNRFVQGIQLASPAGPFKHDPELQIRGLSDNLSLHPANSDAPDVRFSPLVAALFFV